MATTKALVEYEVYVPTRNGRGRPLPRRPIARARRELLEFFGGLTDTRQRNEGIWKVGGIEVRDEIVIWRILSGEGRRGDAFLRKTKAALERELEQDEILVIRRSVAKLR